MENPKIRFKGFTKDWEQRKVSEITKFHKQGFYTTEEYDNSKKYYLLRGTDLTENKLVLKDTPKIDATEKDYDAFKTEIGDFLIVRSGTVGTYGIVDVDIPAIFGSYLIDFRFDMEQVTNEFFGYFYQSSLFKSQLNKIIQASANTNINAENIKSTVISLPSLNEQRRISEYLGNLDNLITLHQRKCEQTKKLKKYMLQKMFPQNGAKVPEIRFDGFTYDWEQRKLGDVAEFSKGNGYSKGDLIESGTPIILYGRLYTKYETIISEVDTYVEAKEGSVYSKGGEVIVPASGETAEDIARAATVDKSGILLGGDLNVVMPNKDINPAFLAISISNGNSQRELSKKAQGKSVVHIHNEEIRNLVIPFPNKVEQNKIVAYFANLDNLITLHQRKCDELKKMKKYMLQNMFI